MNTRPLRVRLAAGLAVTALLATGCASSTDDDTNADGPSTPKEGTAQNAALEAGFINVTDAGEPVKGGVLRIADYTEPRSQDPGSSSAMANGAVGGNTLAAIYDTLVRYDWESSTWEPQLAESLTQTKPTTWTLTLRKGTTFSDGTPVNADAVVASVDRYVKGYGYNFVTWTANVTDVKKVNDTTVAFTTRSDWKTFPAMLAQAPGMIVAPTAYKNPAKFVPIGAGPFTFKSYAPGEKLEVVANEKYVNGRPHLDGITWTWPGADQGKFESLENGDVDGVFVREPIVVAKAIKAKKPGMLFVTGGGATLTINTREGHPGANPKVRQAISLAMDPVKYYERNKDTDAVPNKQLTPETSPWFTKVDVPTPSIAEAKKVLDEAKAEGFDGKITYTSLGDPVSTAAATNVKAMLEAAGFSVTLDTSKDIADQTKKVFSDYSFDLAMGAVSIGQEAPYVGLAGPLLPGSPTNASGIDDPEMVKALVELAAAETPEEGKPALAKVEELWQELLPAVNLADGNLSIMFDADVHGFEPSTQMLTLFDKAWMSK